MQRQKPLFDLEKLTAEQALYALAFSLALGLRLLLLDHSPLTENEASWANQAFALSRGESAILGPQPLYVLFTTLVFWLIKAGEAWARLLPVLSGSLLVLLPPLFRPWSGDSLLARRASLVLAFGLALDPAQVALSRQAGSSMPALAFLLLAIGLGVSRRWRLAGITAGLALLSGLQFWQGLLGLVLTWGAVGLLARRSPVFSRLQAPPAMTGSEETPPSSAALSPVRTLLIYASGVILLGGTLFLRFPQGLSAFASIFPAYLQSWIPASSDLLPAPALRLPLALFYTQPVVVLFAILAILRLWLSKESSALYNLGRKLSLWAALAFILALLNPNRQVSDVVWALIPLWALAALELASCVPGETERDDLPIVLTLTAVTAILMALFLYNLLRLFTLGAQPWLFATVLGGIVLMILVISLIIAAGWSFAVARLGFLWGITLVLGIPMLSNLWYSGFTAPSQPGDLWGHPPAAGQVTDFLQTLGDLSEWRTGHRNEIDTLVTVDSAALRWQLRSFPNVAFSTGIVPGSMPSVVITAQEQTSLDLALAYRGQDFTWWQYPGWSGLLPVQWLDWLYFHKAPGTAQQIILWARGDLFPGGVLTPTSTSETQPASQYEEDFVP